MGLQRNWTIEEIEFLERKWGNMTLKNIAKNLNRSEYAIRLKAGRLGLGNFCEAGDYVLLKHVIIALGYCYVESVVDKFIKYNFPIKIIKHNKRKYRKVNLEEFWKWAENNKEVLNFTKFEKNALGKEPTWVDEKRKRDILTTGNKYAFWTKDEENLLVSKAKSGRYDLLDLSIDFNRTEAAIRRKYFDLTGEVVPNKRAKNKKYTEKEEKRILELKEQGYDFCYIAKELKRSELGIVDKYKRLVG